MTWRQIRAELYPAVPAGTLCAVAKGREPRKSSVRIALGLPVDPVILPEITVCSCGCGQCFVGKVPHQKRLPGHARRRTIRA